MRMKNVVMTVETSEGAVTSAWREAKFETTPPKREGNRAYRRSQTFTQSNEAPTTDESR